MVHFTTPDGVFRLLRTGARIRERDTLKDGKAATTKKNQYQLHEPYRFFVLHFFPLVIVTTVSMVLDHQETPNLQPLYLPKAQSIPKEK